MVTFYATQPKIRAFSLVEVIVSIGIVGVIIVMLNTVVVNMTIVSQKSLARSFVREEISEAMDRIVSDIRNADRINSCSGSGTGATCQISNADVETWGTCSNNGVATICKRNASGNVIYQTSSTMKVDQLSFEEGISVDTNFTKRNILVTIVGSHVNDNLDVKTIIRQTVVSTRNYILD